LKIVWENVRRNRAEVSEISLPLRLPALAFVTGYHSPIGDFALKQALGLSRRAAIRTETDRGVFWADNGRWTGKGKTRAHPRAVRRDLSDLPDMRRKTLAAIHPPRACFNAKKVKERQKAERRQGRWLKNRRGLTPNFRQRAGPAEKLRKNRS